MADDAFPKKSAYFLTKKSLFPDGLSPLEKEAREYFIRVLFDKEVQQQPSLLKAEATALDGLVPAFQKKLDAAVQAHKSISASMKQNAGTYYPLSSISSAVRAKLSEKKLGSPELIREKNVLSIVFGIIANDPSFADSTRQEELQFLVDRRVQLVERMFFDVLTVGTKYRVLGKQLVDGVSRMFEFPDLTDEMSSAIKSACNPVNGICSSSGAFSGWELKDISGTERLYRDPALCKAARPFWDGPLPLGNGIYYPFECKSGVDPVAAIKSLCNNYPNFFDRNLLACDHVLHILHLDALVFAKGRRKNEAADWLAKEVQKNEPGWLQIYSADPGDDRNNRFLGARGSRYFSHVKIRKQEVQLGDHLIFFNHPLYDVIVGGGLWRLENSMVVQVAPELLLMGHGLSPVTENGMRENMIVAINRRLKEARAKVNNVKNPAPGTSIAFSGAAIVYDTPPGQHLEWWIKWQWGPAKDSRSRGYYEKRENEIVASPDLVAEIYKKQKVFYQQTGTVGGRDEKQNIIELPVGDAWFPLWEQRHDKGKPSDRAEVTMETGMIAGWSWLFFSDKTSWDRTRFWVIQPSL